MHTLIGILVEPREADRIVLIINAMQASKHWLSNDECLHEIFTRGIFATAQVYINDREAA